MNLDVRVEELENGYIFIDLAGDMDAYASREFKQVVEELMTHMKYKLIVDMEKVTCLDSVGARGLLSALSKTREGNGDLWLIYDKSPVKRFLDITGLNENFTTFKTSKQAFQEVDTP